MVDTTGASWSDIPLDLAGRILYRLPAHVDRVRFGAVCPQWHAATRHGPQPQPLPLLLLSDARAYSLPGNEPFHFSRFTGTGYTDACGDWLVFSGEEGRFLRHAFSDATVTLPPLSRVRTRLVGRDGGPVWSQAPPTGPATMKRRPNRLTLAYYGSDGNAYLTVARRGRDRGELLHVGNESIDVATLAWMEMADSLELYEEPEKCKVWLCTPNFIVATIKFIAGKRIAVCRAEATSWWSVYLEDYYPDFIDMAFHQGKLYALFDNDSLYAIDVSMDHSSGDPWISQLRKVINGPCLHVPYPLGRCQKRAYLVESSGVLLVVLRKLNYSLIDLSALFEAEPNDFEVFEADLSRSQWFTVTAIGNNEVLFLRQRCSRSVCVSHNALPGGCIFFLDNNAKDSSWYGPSSSCGVYSMTDGKVSNPMPTVSWKPRMAFGTWFFPQN